MAQQRRYKGAWMQTVIVVRDSGATIAEAVAEAVVRSAGQRVDQTPALQSAWQAVKEAIEQSALTPRQRELVLLDMLGLRRSQIAEVMGVTPATLTTYWKAIYERYDLHGADARAALHGRLFPHLQVSTLFQQL